MNRKANNSMPPVIHLTPAEWARAIATEKLTHLYNAIEAIKKEREQAMPITEQEKDQLILDIDSAVRAMPSVFGLQESAELANRLREMADKLKPKPELPPIPLGSRFFRDMGRPCFTEQGLVIHLDNKVDSGWRYIIATVAIEEWRQLWGTTTSSVDAINQWRAWRDRK